MSCRNGGDVHFVDEVFAYFLLNLVTKIKLAEVRLEKVDLRWRSNFDASSQFFNFINKRYEYKAPAMLTGRCLEGVCYELRRHVLLL